MRPTAGLPTANRIYDQEPRAVGASSREAETITTTNSQEDGEGALLLAPGKIDVTGEQA